MLPLKPNHVLLLCKSPCEIDINYFAIRQNPVKVNTFKIAALELNIIYAVNLPTITLHYKNTSTTTLTTKNTLYMCFVSL